MAWVASTFWRVAGLVLASQPNRLVARTLSLLLLLIMVGMR